MVSILAHIGMFGAFVWFIWLPLVLIVTLTTPKALLNKYLKEPHFSKGELVAFSSFPTLFMRTALFCRLYLTPKAVKGRKLYGFVEDSPKWYRVAVITSYLGLILHAIVIFSSGSIAILLTP